MRSSRPPKKRERWPLGNPVEIVWKDHVSSGGWRRPESYDDRLALCRTVGYVLRETTETVTLMQSQSSSTGDVSDSTVIGKRLIVRRRRL